MSSLIKTAIQKRRMNKIIWNIRGKVSIRQLNTDNHKKLAVSHRKKKTTYLFIYKEYKAELSALIIQMAQ